MKKNIAEFIWTFALVFFWTGSVVVDVQSWEALWLLWISLVFGIIITSLIYIFWGISWAHINPAVTIALLFWKKIKAKQAIFYIIFQIIWAILASLLLIFLFPETTSLWATSPSGTNFQSFIIEIIMTFFLMLTILGITGQWDKNSKALAWIIIWLFVVWAILISWPISGGSFNPARSLAPALVFWDLSNIWIYLFWPIIWSVWAMSIWNFIKNEEIDW